MMRLSRRRRWGIAITVTAAGLFAAGDWWVASRLGHASYWSGGTLLACLVLLMLLGMRRRLVMLPLWRVATWVQIHLYTGLFSLVVYAFHVPTLVANGWLEGGLSWLFLLCSASGLYGLYASRALPKKLNAVPGEYRFDRFAWHRQRLSERADEVLAGLELSLASPVLASYYHEQLQPYFSAGTPVGFVLLPHGRRRQRLLSGLRELDRYLEASARQAAGQLAGLIRKRDELDFHFAVQLRLRLWLVVHAVLSVLLLGWSAVHVAMVLLFL